MDPEKSSNPMMAYINMTKITSKAIWSKGTIARTIALSTTCRPERTQNTPLYILLKQKHNQTSQSNSFCIGNNS